MQKSKYTKQGDNIASEVTVSYDPSLIRKKKKNTYRSKEEKMLDKEYEKELRKQQMGSQLSKMGLESSLGRDQRKFELQSLVNKKEVITIQSASLAMSLSKGTIISYAKEMSLQFWDPEENKFAGDPNGKRVGIDI